MIGWTRSMRRCGGMVCVFLIIKVRKILLCFGEFNGDMGGGGDGERSLSTDDSWFICWCVCEVMLSRLENKKWWEMMMMNTNVTTHVRVTVSLHLTRCRNVIYPLGLMINNVPGTLFSLQSCHNYVSTPWVIPFFVLSHHQILNCRSLFIFSDTQTTKKP